MKYDYLVVGSGLYGAIFAHEAKVHGKSVLVVDKRPNIAGNIYTENIEGINVHKYGAHIFHTNNKKVWNYITRFAEFNRFTNSPVANYKGELYSLPFNMYTFNKMWGVVTPEEAAAKIEEQRKEITHEPQNLEEQAISLVGRDIYEKLIKGYTEKQWGRDCKDLPASIIKRLPCRAGEGIAGKAAQIERRRLLHRDGQARCLLRCSGKIRKRSFRQHSLPGFVPEPVQCGAGSRSPLGKQCAASQSRHSQKRSRKHACRCQQCAIIQKHRNGFFVICRAACQQKRRAHPEIKESRH